MPANSNSAARLPEPGFVFGSQYLRGMTPARSEWARDMAAMRRAGFNTIRAWLVWGVLEPRRGEIDFGYLDTFLDLALEHELRVGMLFHLHGCPEWAVRGGAPSRQPLRITGSALSVVTQGRMPSLDVSTLIAYGLWSMVSPADTRIQLTSGS